MNLICTFVFQCAKSKFSHDVAQMTLQNRYYSKRLFKTGGRSIIVVVSTIFTVYLS